MNLAWSYDDFGRLTQSRRRLPGASRWGAEWLTYDSAGRKATQSLSAESTTGAAGAMPATLGATVWTYDALGRVSRVTAPDGKEVSHSYDGPRLVTRTTEVRTASGPESVPTQETYDHLGRLTRVTEDAGGLNLTTDYKYDIGDRLIDVNGPLAPGETRPHRVFTYDGAGLLVSETHLESGTTAYPVYDARGHSLAKRRADCSFDLDFTYDSAERLTHVKGSRYPFMDCTTFIPRPLKELVYETSSSAGDLGLGKLRKAIRYNSTEVGDVKVTETYTYGDAAGRVTVKQTSVELGPSTLQTFKQSFVYDDLGEQTRHSFPTCLTIGCGAAPTDGQKIEYANGFAVSTSAFKGSNPLTESTTPLATFAYHANGMKSTVAHANGVTDTVELDAGQPRPSKITFSGFADDCTAPSVAVTPGSKSVTAGASETLQAAVSPSGVTVTYQWKKGFGDIPGATSSFYTTGSLNQTSTYSVRVVTPCGTAESNEVTFTVGIPVPLNLSATRSGSADVLVSWSASTGAAKYTVERRSGTSSFQPLAQNVTATSYLDPSCPAGATCAYRVRALTSANAASDPSNVDVTTMINFTTIGAGSTTVQLPHFTQMLAAVNAVRTATGVLAPQSWSAMLPPGVPVPVVGGMVDNVHITALRVSLNEALQVFGIPLTPYTDALDQPTKIKAIHLQQIMEKTQ